VNINSKKALSLESAGKRGLVDQSDARWYMRQRHRIAELAKAVRINDKIAVRRLLDTIVDIEARDPEGLTPLMVAILQGADEGVVSMFIQAGADVNAHGPDNRSTPLTLAASRSAAPEVIAVLLEAGADIQARLADGTTALSIAAAKSKSQLIIEGLLKAGAEVDSVDDVGATPLMHALVFHQPPAVVSLLLSAGADVRRQDHGGRNPLMLAASRSTVVEVIDLLLSHGPDLRAKDREGHIAYVHAAMNDKGRNVMRRVFTAYRDATRTAGRFRSELEGRRSSIGDFEAGQRTSCNNDIVPAFDDEKDDEFRIILQRIEEVDGCIVFYLSGYLDRLTSNLFQKRVSKAIENGFTKLIFNVYDCYDEPDFGTGTYTAFLKAVKPLGGDIVLLQIRTEVYDVYHELGFSQFFNIKENLAEAIAFFSSKGRAAKGDIFPRIFECPICSKRLRAYTAGRFRCSECKTILAISDAGEVTLGEKRAERMSNFFELIKTATPGQLQEAILAGADPNAKDENGETPLMYAAAYNGNSGVMTALLKAGADINARSKDGKNALMCAAQYNQNQDVIAILIEAGASIKARDKDGWTALMYVAGFNQNPEAITKLLQAGADINTQDKGGLTALMEAARRNPNPEMTTFLLKAGADIRAMGKGRHTALMFAAKHNKNPEVMIALLNAGADVNAKDRDGVNALMYAAKCSQNLDVVISLLKGRRRYQRQGQGRLDPADVCSQQ
jgi:anti-sigma B factor antagonist